ncbi:MAG TPA: YbaN family protein [Ignavibacteria bacterium]|nr:YbaN family protein [Ignavibacteria bacterium]
MEDQKNYNADNKVVKNKFNRNMLVLAGHTFVGLGIIGALLPIMPTTIFLILAGTCYAKSSPKFYNWLMKNKFFGKYLSNYKDKKGTPLSVKIISISVLWITITYSLIFTEIPLYVVIILLIIGIGVTWHLIAIKTLKH